MKTCYNYTRDFVFSGIGEALLDPIEKTAVLPAYATFTPVPPFNKNLQFAIFNKDLNKWIVHDFCEEGIYFEKTNGKEKKIEKYFIGDLEKYTKEAPNLKTDSNTTIHFINGKWEYKQVDRQFLENLIIESLRQECSKRIRSFKGSDIPDIDWLQKSQNFQDIKATYLSEQGAVNSGVKGVKMSYTKDEYEYAAKVINRKENLRMKYHIIKNKIIQMSLEELKNFNSSDEKHWQ